MATIDENWIELQTGLYLEEYNLVIGGTVYLRRILHSSEGYCFKDMADMVWDEELQAERQPTDEERVYYAYMSLAIAFSSWTHEQLNTQFISVPRQDWMEVANNPTTPDHEIM